MKKELLLAAAAAGLAAGCAGAGRKWAADPMVRCWGVNRCSGQGLCAGKQVTCAGSNSCKGRGWLEMKKSECGARGGRLEE